MALTNAAGAVGCLHHGIVTTGLFLLLVAALMYYAGTEMMNAVMAHAVMAHAVMAHAVMAHAVDILYCEHITCNTYR